MITIIKHILPNGLVTEVEAITGFNDLIDIILDDTSMDWDLKCAYLDMLNRTPSMCFLPKNAKIVRQYYLSTKPNQT